jgi:hypothetical protein
LHGLCLQDGALPANPPRHQLVADSRILLVHRADLRGLRVFPLYSTASNVPLNHSYFYAVPGAAAIPQFDISSSSM